MSLHGTFSMQPSDEFRMTPDTSRETKAVFFGREASDAIVITCEKTGESCIFRVGGQVVPVRTKEAVIAAGYTVVYLY